MDTLLLCSAYLPPVSFFTAINSGGDVLIEQYDNYCKQTYRNRCKISTASGIQTLTIPVVKSDTPKQLMKDVRISIAHFLSRKDTIFSIKFPNCFDFLF